jgi:hypothetical protein
MRDIRMNSGTNTKLSKKQDKGRENRHENGEVSMVLPNCEFRGHAKEEWGNM